jgi:hypothetical protein
MFSVFPFALRRSGAVVNRSRVRAAAVVRDTDNRWTDTRNGCPAAIRLLGPAPTRLRRVISPSVMRVVLDAVPAPAEALVIRERPVPRPEPGWVLIEVKAFGLNRSELAPS